MDTFPEFYRSVSFSLSAVMDAVGVSKDIVLKRRDAYLKRESMRSIFYQLSGLNIKTYHFGSQTEGATTPEMGSDLDTLDCQQNFNVITNSNFWQVGKENMFMIQNNATPPGHCRLHEVDYLPEFEDYPHEECLYDEQNRLILPNTFSVNVEKSAFQYLGLGYERHGPSGSPFPDMDIVNGFLCASWPSDSAPLGRPRALHWLSSETISEVLKDGCFIVSVGHPESENEHVEWRISFSKSERVLMFNMNIIQIKCYVLLKLIKNEVLKSIAGDRFTSYHCKLVLLFTIERLPNGFWVSENLLPCLFMCLRTLRMFLISAHCPHVFNPAVNLFSGKINLRLRLGLLNCITDIINDKVRCLLSIESDYLGKLLLAHVSSMGNIQTMTYSSDLRLKTARQVTGKLAYDRHVSLCGDLISVLLYTIRPEQSDRECIQRIFDHVKNSVHVFIHGDCHEKASAQMFVAYLSPFLASLYVAYSNDHVPEVVYSLVDVLNTLSESSVCTDIASSKLKLATLYYYKGDLEKASGILKTIENMFEKYVTPICGNCDCNDSPRKEFVDTVFFMSNETIAKTCIAHCVTFLRQEFPCCPFELRYEMYRSTGDDIRHRKERIHEWMDWAEVDAEPYLYFLQFLTYKKMNNEDLQYEAMFKLASLLEQSPPIYHPETAFNLLGQCWEHKNNENVALMCYDASLRLVCTNNVAKWHLAKLVYRKICKSNKLVECISEKRECCLLV